MRINSAVTHAVAAAFSAVVFSAAFQPAEASSITIDAFTQAQVASGSGSSTVTVFAGTSQTGSFGGFDTRNIGGYYGQSEPRGNRTVLATSSGTGTGTLRLTNTVSSGTTNPLASNASLDYYNLSGSAVNLTGQTGFLIETGSTSSSPAGAFKGYITVATSGTSLSYVLPGMWAPNTSTEISFSTLTALAPGLDFTQVTHVTVGIGNADVLTGLQAYDATANFTRIAVVPEPTQMVSVAAAGAALGMWRLRKLRRNRGESAIATA